MDLCPGTLQQECGRPLKSGEDLCPSCRSQERRMRPRRGLMLLAGPIGWSILALEILLEKVVKGVRQKS